MKLVAADLLMARMTLGAGTAPPDERHRHPFATLPSANILARSDDNPGELMTRHVGESDVRIVTDPAVPVASAHPGRFDFEHDAVWFG